jgi:hypothetical protein
MLNFTYIENDELPHRVVIDHLHGAGQTRSDAVVAALSAGNVFPPELRGDKKAIAAYLFWNYRANPDWVELIHILEEGEL